ncbi:MAG TPA: hypothetical protein VND65_14340 [Candidatus Binatia bacterium]|nr:hypothetical protein [Candidatus Binatia bacterium]
MSTKVLCTPGEHPVFAEQAYWCDSCGFYLCHRHAVTTMLVDDILCPSGHLVIEPERVAVFEEARAPVIMPRRI